MSDERLQGGNERRTTSFTVVIPCFNEAARFPQTAAADLVAAGCRVVVVDDGSTDGTRELLDDLATRFAEVSVVALERNHGKAEAVRQGLQMALRHGADVVGFLDADMSTPPSEMIRLGELLCSNPELVGVIGARVNMLGTSIERSPFRHYFGRVFASLASFAVGVPVYDTQCGAKVFRPTPELRAVLSQPFASPWAFDVELLVRLRRLGQLHAIHEEPLRVWRSVDGSKLSVPAMLLTTMRLAVFAVRCRRDRNETTRRSEPGDASERSHR